jgi:peptidoglycan/LPS O-acetylase OafA/YrhL
MPLLLLPWTMAVAAGLASAWRGLRREGTGHSSADGFALAAGWMLSQLVFYSVIPPKRDLYLLPAYPAAALLAAGALAQFWRRRRLPSWIGIGSPLVLLVVGSALSLVWLATDQVGGLWWRGPLIGLPLVAGGILAVTWLKRGRLERWAVAILASWCAFGVLLAVAGLHPINPLKSARQLAVELVERPERPSEIPCWGVQPEGYRFYSDGRLPVVSSDDLAGALNREGPEFLALVRRAIWLSVDPYLKARLRVLLERQVGGKDIVVLGAAVP